MKRFVSLGLVLVLLFTSAAIAFADGTILADQADRKISPVNANADGTIPVNPVIQGESQTTGLPFTGTYAPMLVQISVPNGGVSGKDIPWGIGSGDIFYETPLHKMGHTRFAILFSDDIPSNVGPVRSTRIMHAEIREEWDAGFIYFGQQEYKTSNVKEKFSETGANKKGILFSGTANSDWKPFVTRDKTIGTADNVMVDVKSIQAFIPQGYPFPYRPYLFTDELNYQGAAANTISITQRHPDYSSTFSYDAATNTYTRFVGKENLPFMDKLTQQNILFSNVVVQRTDVTYKRNDAPLATLIGSGNADIFIGGKYIAGYWVRTGMDQRTVFLDESGNEIKLQRGKTLISIQDHAIEVSYK